MKQSVVTRFGTFSSPKKFRKTSSGSFTFPNYPYDSVTESATRLTLHSTLQFTISRHSGLSARGFATVSNRWNIFGLKPGVRVGKLREKRV